MNIDELAQQQETAHPGYLLADWYNAALPSYEVYLRVQMQVEQPLPAIDQFVLRALEAGVKTTDEIGGVLGLEYTIVCDALERLQRMGFIAIARTSSSGKQQEILYVTPKGRNILQTLVFLRPEEESLAFCLDALTGEYYPHRRLYTTENIRDADLHQVPPYLTAPAYDEIEVIALRRVWREVQRTLPKGEHNKELLDVLGIEKAFLGYRPMRVLQFIRRADGVVLPHVYDGVERSPQHEAALLKMEAEGIRALRAEVKRGPEAASDPAADILGADVYEAALLKTAEVPRLKRDIAKLEQQIQDADALQRSSTQEDVTLATRRRTEVQEDIERLTERIRELESSAPTVQILSMAEHRPRLLQALQDAEKRVIIISPWLTPTAVNRELQDLIAQRIADGIEIWIGHGFGEPDHREEKTLRDLERIQKGKGGRKLHLHRLEETHAKVVICDSKYMITTSFNWLSFAGRPDWGNRVEFGTLTTDPAAVEAMLDRLMSLFTASSTQTAQPPA
jgi:DNA-binding MarR family transcriptional regulator